MVSENSPDWLPSGWTMRLKANDSGRRVKCYIDPASGRKFYSKSQVSRYLETLNSCSTPQRGISSADNIVEERNESLEWLPHGWTVESKTRNSGAQIGKKFKIYIEPTTGLKFYSKPEVSRYLKKISSGTAPQIGISSVKDHSIDHSTGGGTSLKPDVSHNSKTNRSSISEQKSSISEQKKLHGGKNSTNNVVVESVSVRELPSGWITEIKSRKNVDPKHKDLSYTDPVSGYVFRSKLDALRYLETGDINKCKMKPKKRDTNDLVSLNNGISQSMDSTGDGTSSNPNVSQSCKMNKSSITKQKKLHGVKHSTNNVVIERVSADELPAGWIKEITTRKIADRIHKDSYYTDPVSGYKFFSKTDALRYLKSGDVNSCKIKPKKRDINDLELIKDEDISHSMDHLTVGGTSSNPDVSQNCKTDDSSIPKQKELYGVKHSVNDVVVERVSADEFPPGWIKEIRTRKVGNRIQKDPYYKDPLSGYVFRSKLDALRYLETGDINSCKMKPKKRDINGLELNDEDISPSSAVVGKKLNTTTRRLRFGKERSDIGLSSSLVAPEVGNSKERRGNVSNATTDFSSPTVEIPEAKRTKESSEPIRKDSKREESIKVSAANEIISSVINDILQGEKLSENGTVKHSNRKAQSSIKSKNKRTLSLPFRASKRLAGLKPEMQPDNSIITQALPAAAIGCGETEANLLSDLTLNASTHKVPQQLEAEAERRIAHDASILHIESSKKSGRRLEDQSVPEKHPGMEEAEKHNDDKLEKEAAHHAFISGETILDVESLNKREKEMQEAVPEKQPGMEEAEKHNDDKPEKEAARNASISRETILDVELLNKREKELQEAVSEKQPWGQVTGKQNDGRPESQELPLDYPFMDSWIDPCLEFAFKTLTGAIPVEENLSFHDYFQAEAPQTQKKGGLEQPESVPPSVTQNDFTSHFEATEKSASVQQLPANPTYLSPGDVSLPSCSITNPQVSSLEAGNSEHQTKVN